MAEAGLIPLGIYMTGSRPLVDNSFFSMVKLLLTVWTMKNYLLELRP